MKLSTQGAALIKQREGCRLVVYDDGAGNLTAGIGHRLLPGSKLKAGDAITPSQRDTWFVADCSVAANAVNVLVDVPLNQDQFDALVSFVFNIGVDDFTTSTLLKLLNQRDYTGAKAQFVRWHYIHVGGKKVSDDGLLNRRLAEAAQFGALQAHPASSTQPPGAAPAVPRPAAPPHSVTQTTTGRLQIGAVVSGGVAAAVQGIGQIQPVLNGIQQVNSTVSGLPHWLSIVCAVLVIACIGACAATLIHKHRSL